MYTTRSNYRHANYDVNQTVFFEMLSACQSEEIYVTALEVLERTGSKVLNKKAREIFSKNGCFVEGELVYLPSAKVEQAVAQAPHRLTLCDQKGERCMLLETQNSHLGAGFGSAKVLDRKDQSIRPAVLEDVVEQAKVCQQLRHVEFATPAVIPGDCPEKTAPLAAFQALAEHTLKPVVLPVESGEQAGYAIEMAQAIVGGETTLRRNPYLVLYTRCGEALLHTEAAMDIVIRAANGGVPVIYGNDLVSGLTAPYASAGTLVVALANTLLALTLAQMVCAGAPVISGGRFTINDEANQSTPYGAPEASLMASGYANLLHSLRLPCANWGGISDSCLSDTQLGLEACCGIVSNSLGGSNLIYGAGQLEGGKIFSVNAFAIADEISALIRRIMQNIIVDEDRIGRGVINEISPGGNYLGTDHTNVFFKIEQYWPNLQSRLRVDDWMEAGEKSMGRRAGEYVEQLLHAPQQDTPAGAKGNDLQAIIAKAEKAL